MIDLSAFHALAQTPLEAFAPKPTSFEGDQQEASVALFTSANGRVDLHDGVGCCKVRAALTVEARSISHLGPHRN